MIKDLDKCKVNAKSIVKILKKRYGNEPICHLKAHSDYEFLFAVILSAQCKDERVNEVTRVLYKKYKTIKSFYNANIKDIEKIIHPLGFYKNKSKSLINCARKLIDVYGGKLPDTFDELIRLPGVGHKTANVVIGNIFKRPAMAVDTHVKRISNKLFSLNETNPDKIEIDLRQIISKNDMVLWNTHIISFGREICSARNPKCSICPINKYCENFNKVIR